MAKTPSSSASSPRTRGMSWSMVTLAIAACWIVYEAGAELNSPVLWALAIGVLLGRRTALR